jgi:hypothetical protein
MKNPFIKENNTGLWIAAAVGSAIAAAAGIWFYQRGKRAAELEAYRREHAQDYLENKKHQMKKHKTDLHELGDLVHHDQA